MARGEKIGPEPLEQAFRLPLFLGWQGRLNRHGWMFLASGRRRWLRGGELLDGGFLHAYRLGFTHPVTGERLEFTAPDPPEFSAFRASVEAAYG